MRTCAGARPGRTERAFPRRRPADHVFAVHRLLPARYRLPLLVLDATGMRIGELEAFSWGDFDEPRGRWRVSQAVSKTGQGRWVNVPPALRAPAELGSRFRPQDGASSLGNAGNSRATFRRAIERGNLVVAEITAREIGRLSLVEALELTPRRRKSRRA